MFKHMIDNVTKSISDNYANFIVDSYTKFIIDDYTKFIVDYIKVIVDYNIKSVDITKILITFLHIKWNKISYMFNNGKKNNYTQNGFIQRRGSSFAYQ